MEIVIEIDDEMYKQVNTNDDVYVLNDIDCILIENAIANGTPLPKGHGRLIDADRYREEMLHSREFNFFTVLGMQPTIIKADGSEE